MALRKFLILASAATVALIPTAVVLQGSESRPAAGLVHLTGAAIETLTDTLDNVRGSLNGERLGRRAASVPEQAVSPPSEQRADATAHPWDDPDWEDKVAAKILEKLLEQPLPPSATLSSPSPDANRPSWEAPPLPRAAQDGIETGSTTAVNGDAHPLAAPGQPVSGDSPDAQGAVPQEGDSDLATGETPDLSEPAPEAPELAEAPAPGEPSTPLPPPRPSRLAVAKLTPPESERHSGRPMEELKEGAKDIATEYLLSLSLNTRDALAALQGASTPRIEYHGNSISRKAWLERKRKFAETWPVRTYRHRPGSVSVECFRDSKCLVRSTVDWEAASPARRDYASGSSKLELGIDLSGNRPKIHSETNLRIRDNRNLRRPLRLLPPDQTHEISDATGDHERSAE